MIDLAGRIESEALPQLLVFLCRLGRNGRLRITRGPLAGELDFLAGAIVAASCGADHGLGALATLILVPDRAEFNFTPCDPTQDGTLLELDADAVERYLATLEPRRARIAASLPSLSATLRSRDLGSADLLDETQITLRRIHMALLLASERRRSVRTVLADTPILRGLDALVDLVELGLVAAEEQSSALPQPIERPSVRARLLALLRRRSRHMLSLRILGWAAIGVFVFVSAMQQFPDIVRRFGYVAPLQLHDDVPPSTTTGLPVAATFDAGPTSIPWPSDPGGSFWLGSDGYHLMGPEVGRFVAIAPLVGTYSQAVVLNARFQVLEGPPGAAFGFVIRDQGPFPRDGQSQFGHFLLLAITDTGQAIIRRRDGEQWSGVPAAVSSTDSHQPARVNELEVAAVGGHISFRVNGSDIATVEDPSPAPGGIGLYEEGAGNHILVDKLTIAVPSADSVFRDSDYPVAAASKRRAT